MNILISNDDGYQAEGLAILARVAAEFANVRVVAPERNRSGASNSLTLDRPLRIQEAANGFYFVDGIAEALMRAASSSWLISPLNNITTCSPFFSSATLVQTNVASSPRTAEI